MSKTLGQAILNVDYYLENARYILLGAKQLNTKDTLELKAQLNRVASQLQSVKELYIKAQQS